MDEFIKIDVDNISIIVEKFEKGEFSFHNPKREFDGFVLITSGTGFAYDKYGNEFPVESGDMLVVRKNDKYGLYFPSDCSYITSAYSLLCDSENELINRLPFIMKLHNTQIQSIRTMYSVWQRREWHSYTLCRIELIKMYIELIKQTIKTSTADKDVLSATKYIHKNFKKNFSGKDISDFCSISISHLRTKFLNQTGETIISYRDRLRISSAKEMLESGIFSITEISAELGYCDVYHFSKVFKKYVGMPPSEYAKLY